MMFALALRRGFLDGALSTPGRLRMGKTEIGRGALSAGNTPVSGRTGNSSFKPGLKRADWATECRAQPRWGVGSEQHKARHPNKRMQGLCVVERVTKGRGVYGWMPAAG